MADTHRKDFQSSISGFDKSGLSKTQTKVSRIDGSSYVEGSRTGKRKLKIALGSGSAIKRAALESVFKNFGIITFGAPSGVSEQPVGNGETETGACNRAKAAQDKFPHAVAWIGIENGMMKSDNIWVDKAAIVCIFNQQFIETEKEHHTFWSDIVEIPDEAVQKCINTEGIAIQNWSPLKDPHYELTNGEKPRQKFLEEALQNLRDTFDAKFKEALMKKI